MSPYIVLLKMNLFYNGDSIDKFLQPLKLFTLRAICKEHAPQIPGHNLNSRPKLCAAISYLTSDNQAAIMKDVLAALVHGDKKYAKQKVTSDVQAIQAALAVSTAGPGTVSLPSSPPTEPSSALSPLSFSSSTSSGHPVELSQTTVDGDVVMDEHLDDLLTSNFMKAVEQSLKDSIIRNFMEQTNNAALTMSICGVCAREEYQNNVTVLSLLDIPHSQHLSPLILHPMHTLYGGLLLHPEGISLNLVLICDTCLDYLKKDQIPRFSLTNNMWIGNIPCKLAILTLPERMLIAKYFPAAYIVKLYHKQRGSHNWDRSQMHSGLQGNVSMYHLDLAQVAGMIDGRLMPPPVTILSATIGVTFVTPKNTPERTMPNMFRICRARV